MKCNVIGVRTFKQFVSSTQSTRQYSTYPKVLTEIRTHCFMSINHKLYKFGQSARQFRAAVLPALSNTIHASLQVYNQSPTDLAAVSNDTWH